jgi:two-component system NarL family sensor kinase
MKQDVHALYAIGVATLVVAMLILSMIIWAQLVARHLSQKNKDHLKNLQVKEEQAMKVASHEVHDNLSQLHSIALLLLATLRENSTVATLDQLQEVLERSYAVAKDISHSLNPVYLERQMLIPSIEEKVRWVNASSSIECLLNVNGDPLAIDGKYVVIIFRIVQEALNNIITHAGASRIAIQMDYHKNGLWLTIIDNGKGFDREHPGFKEGLGMISMQQRAAQLQGKLEISSYPDEGTLLSLYIPLDGLKSEKSLR